MKMRCYLCSFVCAGLMVAVAWAQPPGGGRGMGMGMGMGGGLALLKNKDVAADLKLTEEQVKKIDELDKSINEKRRSLMQENQGDREGIMNAMQELAKETDKGLSQAISADQLKRYKQLQLQNTMKNGGLMVVLMNPEHVKALNLTEEQIEQLQGFREDQRNTMQEMFQGGGGGGDRREMMKKMQEYSASLNKKVAKMLTEEQNQKLKEMQGEPFKGEFPSMQMGGRRGPGKNG